MDSVVSGMFNLRPKTFAQIFRAESANTVTMLRVRLAESFSRPQSSRAARRLRWDLRAILFTRETLQQAVRLLGLDFEIFVGERVVINLGAAQWA